MIRTAIVGYGFSAKTFHIPFLLAQKNFQWTHTVTGHPEAFALDFTEVHCVSTVEQLLAQDIDLAVITTPNHLHFEQAKYCLEHGMHVVLEKPMVVSSQQATDLIAISHKTRKHVFVFQNRRWDGDFLTIRSIIDNNQIGQVKRLTSRFDRYRPDVRERWREQPGAGVGMLWDLGPHLIDQAVALFGKPNSVTARVATLRNNAVVDDHFDLWLDYDDIQVTLGSTSYQAGPNPRFVLEGTEGTFIKHGIDVQEDDLKRGADVTDPRWGQEPDSSWGILYTLQHNRIVITQSGNYAGFWQQVGLAIETGTEPPVSLDDAYTVIRIIELAHQSAQSGRRLEFD